MSRHDETGGWIFSDDAHTWMDRRGQGLSSVHRRAAGANSLAGGIFTLKSDDDFIRGAPGARIDADGPHTDFADAFGRGDDVPDLVSGAGLILAFAAEVTGLRLMCDADADGVLTGISLVADSS